VSAWCGHSRISWRAHRHWVPAVLRCEQQAVSTAERARGSRRFHLSAVASELASDASCSRRVRGDRFPTRQRRTQGATLQCLCVLCALCGLRGPTLRTTTGLYRRARKRLAAIPPLRCSVGACLRRYRVRDAVRGDRFPTRQRRTQGATLQCLCALCALRGDWLSTGCADRRARRVVGRRHGTDEGPDTCVLARSGVVPGFIMLPWSIVQCPTFSASSAVIGCPHDGETEHSRRCPWARLGHRYRCP